MKCSKDVLKEITKVTASNLSSAKMWMLLEDLNYHYEMLRAIEAGALQVGKPQVTLTGGKNDPRRVRNVLSKNRKDTACQS